MPTWCKIILRSAAITAAAAYMGFPARAADRAALRVIDDPSTGARWILYASVHGGPGELVRTPLSFAVSPAAAQPQSPAPAPSAAVIRGGDPVMIEEHTPVADARLEAVALAPAHLGARLQVRLKLGGHMVSAIALGPGRVAFAPQERMQP